MTRWRKRTPSQPGKHDAVVTEVWYFRGSFMAVGWKDILSTVARRGSGAMQYRFGDYALDTHRCELRHAGRRIPLRPKVFDVLCYLIAQRDRVIAQHELLEQLWPQQFVGEATLRSCIKEPGQAVGDTGKAQRLIQPRHGRGYRFVAAVEERAPRTVDVSAPPAWRPPATGRQVGLPVGREAALTC